MQDSLPAVRTCVRDKPVAVLCDAFLQGELTGHREKMTNQRFILGLEAVDRFDVFVRHDEDVRWCSGMDVSERGHLLIAIDDGCLGFILYDPTKDAIGHVVIYSKDGFSEIPKGRRQESGHMSVHKRYHNIPTRWLYFVQRTMKLHCQCYESDPNSRVPDMASNVVAP